MNFSCYSFVMKIPWLPPGGRDSNPVLFMLLILLLISSNSRCDNNSQKVKAELNSDFFAKTKQTCAGLEPTTFENQVPMGRLGHGNSSLMSYKKVGVTSAGECVEKCCEEGVANVGGGVASSSEGGGGVCNMVFMFVNNTVLNCYLTHCARDELCLPTSPDPANAEKIANRSFIVLVTPNDHASWADVRTKVSPSNRAFTKTPTSSSDFEGVECEVGLDLEACRVNEACVPSNGRSRNGVCQCKEGFHRADDGKCVSDGDKTTSPEAETTTKSTTTKKPEPVRLTIKVNSAKVTLPDDSAELEAQVYPKAPRESSYNYEWKLEEGDVPPEGGVEKSQGDKLSLNHLKVGVYAFKVTVTGSDPPAFGEAFANVTVLPAKRINQAPTVVIQPLTQKINLPTNKAIIDASGSQDDATTKDKLVFKWEIVTKPLSYTKELSEQGPTLTLDDLIAGNYTIKLVVTDGDGASNYSEARITVVPENDYPPTANAGEDVIIYLPQREVTLSGNQSTDDHGIVSWEWTRKASVPGAKELAADTQNMRAQNPRISNLEEGMYTFILKVIDGKGQSAEDEVNVYVKPPVNLPPTANAGKDQEISLPQNWVVLDGSASKDDVNISSVSWELVRDKADFSPPPSEVNILSATSLMTNVTGLTKGRYFFRLTVVDNLENRGSDEVEVVVNQDTNSAPKADAGPDLTLTLPLASVTLNGSNSWDDLKVTKFLWTRDTESLAVGKVVGTSDHEAILRVVDVVPGQYAFKLQVWDEQGKSSADSASVTIKENPDKMNVVQAVFEEDIGKITQSRLDGIRSSLSLLLHNSGKYQVKILDLFPETDSNNAVIHFLVVISGDQSSWENANLNRVGNGNGKGDLELNPEVTGASSILDLKPTGTNKEGHNPNVASGKKVVKELRHKLKADADLLSLRIVTLDTLVCQNDCSGHGVCVQATRQCECESYWVQNFVRSHLMDGKSNCEWSVVYVGIFLTVILCAVICLVCYCGCGPRGKGFIRKKLVSTGSGNRVQNRSTRSSRNAARRSNQQRYSRLDQNDPGMELRNAYTSSLMVSDTDSDEEIGFDDARKVAINIPNGAPRNNNNNGTYSLRSSSEDNGTTTLKRNGFSGTSNA